MEDQYYVDDFGNLKKRQNLKDWTEYGPWQFWGHRYNWLKCEADLLEFDRIAWRDNVHIQTAYGEAWHNGARFIIGEVRKIKDSKRGMLACISVIYSEGMEPYDHNDEIYRHIASILKNGLYRAPRYDESGNWCKTHTPQSPREALAEAKKPTKPVTQGEKDKQRNKPSSRFFTGKPPMRPK